MAAYDYGSKFDTNVCLQGSDMETPELYDRRAEGSALRIGALVIPGTAPADQVLPAGADALNVVGVIVGRWDKSNGVWDCKPATAIAAGDKVRILPKSSSLKFIGLLPNGTTTTIMVKLKPAASGRLGLLAGSPAVLDALVYCADAEQAVVAGADDALCAVRWA